MIRKKIILIAIIAILVIIFGVYQGFIKEEKPSFALAEVSRGDIFQEVSETGTVKRGEEINLSFKNAGRIEKIYVKVGDLVKSGQELAKLGTTQLYLQLDEAKANAEAQKAKLIELQKGTRPEEIQISQTLLDKAKTDLDNLYRDVSVILNQAYNLADNGIRQRIAALFLYRAEATTPYYDLTYKYCNDQAANDSTYLRKIVEDELNIWRTELQNLNDNPKILDEAITKTEEYLTVLQNFLNRLNDTLTSDCKLSSEDLNKINTYKSAVNLALTDVNTAFTSVYSQRKVIEAQKLIIQNHQEQLNLKLAGSTSEQITYQEALLKQAEAKVALLQNQIQETTIINPTEGQITKVSKELGEMVQVAEAVISLIPTSPFQIKVDIYEEDIVEIDVGNSVDITLTAFPGQIIKGKVVSIDPAEKLIEGVVYYEITIDFEGIKEGIKPGMTADVVIRTAFKENVLIISEDAIQKKDGKIVVQVSKNGQIEEREIKIGLLGSNDMAEVISGLKEGEVVVLR
ncbi:efflux RND transporter periplasmic adaptor subunit [Patescibacteria group bacterium]|nr:efflux RND transporter periplasmic adaptor subunit [Patescibacteria group bacterium]